MDYKFLILSNSPASHYFQPHLAEKYLPQYAKLRHDVFTEHGMDYYTPELDAFDRHPDTMFIVILDPQDRVVGGRRMLVHEPGKPTKLKTEDFIDMSIKDMMPHLDISPMRYAELGGLAFDASIRKGKLSEEMYRRTFELSREIGCDFLVAELTPTNIQLFTNAARKNGAAQIVFRTDQVSNVADKDFRIFVSFKSEKKLPLLSPAQKMCGLGKEPSSAEITSLIHLRMKGKLERAARPTDLSRY